MARIRKRGKNWAYEIKESKRNGLVSKGGFKTKKEAEKAAKEMEIQLDSHPGYVFKEMTLVELFNEWLHVEVYSQALDIETKGHYARRLNWIENYFGDKLVSHMLRSDYQKFLNAYGETHEINELSRMNANIKKAVEFAKADKIAVDDRFLLNIRLNSKRFSKPVEKKYLRSRADYDRVIEYLLIEMDYRRTVLHFVIYLIFACGLRPAEALALTWPDFDFDNQEIYTHRRWSSSKEEFVPAKNAHYYRKINRHNPSERKVPFDSQVLVVFKDLKSLQERLLRLLGFENEEQFVFFQIGEKNPLPDQSTVNRCLKRILKKLGIEPIITIYGARHTYGSVKVQEGVPLEVLAKWFGHKDTTMLREIYVHLLEETRDEWFEKAKK